MRRLASVAVTLMFCFSVFLSGMSNSVSAAPSESTRNSSSSSAQGLLTTSQPSVVSAYKISSNGSVIPNSVISCGPINVLWPHYSDNQVSVHAKLSCDAPVDHIYLTVYLYLYGTTVSEAAKRYWDSAGNQWLEGYARTDKCINHLYVGAAEGQVDFPYGYSPSSLHISYVVGAVKPVTECP